jgi:hypothetical protein
MSNGENIAAKYISKYIQSQLSIITYMLKKLRFMNNLQFGLKKNPSNF